MALKNHSFVTPKAAAKICLHPRFCFGVFFLLRRVSLEGFWSRAPSFGAVVVLEWSVLTLCMAFC